MSDPVMRDIREFINRSAGQHQRHAKEAGALRAMRLAATSECGFGSCAGDPDCRDRHCPEHPIKTGLLGLPVIDPKFLDEQIKAVDLPIEMIDPIPGVIRGGKVLKTAALIVATMLALACTFYVSLP